MISSLLDAEWNSVYIICRDIRLRLYYPYVNSGKFRVKTEAEQQIRNECARLIANAIVYYNAVLLSRVYEQKKANGGHAAINIIQRISLIAWRHVNLFGNFEFSATMSQVGIEAPAVCYQAPVYWSKMPREQTQDLLRAG